ncbi:sensor histidine kinase [Rhizobium sp. P32RR-XVIII]|uniref:sensor histidine kinase n=1 Tax=Rhizobium sp. P32RR-XVIII TaxID=2726738 RepID=UPI0014563BC0|nr:PAS domain-containing sensor histidine kinase [Rhizobium sp. P32RR-XVIII]NLS08323.1 sensor histidine kinase [Rhizobium sp. P32RR-XVIII]
MPGSMHFLDGGSEMGKALRAYDWGASVLGPLDAWPPSLKIVVGMMLNSTFPKCIAWGPELITIHNDAFLPILGDKPPALGRPFHEVWSEAWEEIGPIAARALAGEATFIEDFPLVVDRHGYPEQAYFTFCYSPIRDEGGVVRGFMDTVIETTGSVEARRQASLLNAELEHRIKNTLAVVSAIVSQTLRATDSDAEARSALQERIQAMAQAQSLLTRASTAEANITDIVHGTIAPFKLSEERFRISGPPVMLSSKQALTLSLALHELSTNAVKYGALSNATGVVRVDWHVGRPNSEDEFRLTWIEAGGPPVVAPTRRGFGSRIIEVVLPHDFAGEAEFIADPSGIRYELRTRMSNIGERDLQSSG